MFLLGFFSRDFPCFSHGIFPCFFTTQLIAEVDADLRSQHPSQCWRPPDPQVAYGLGYGTCGQSGQGRATMGHFLWALLRMFLPCFSLVNIKIAGKWMFIPLKMVLIGIDPYPFCSRFVDDKCCTVTIRNTSCREAQFSNLRVTKKHGSLHMTADPVRLDTQMGHVACRTWGTS